MLVAVELEKNVHLMIPLTEKDYLIAIINRPFR